MKNIKMELLTWSLPYCDLLIWPFWDILEPQEAVEKDSFWIQIRFRKPFHPKKVSNKKVPVLTRRWTIVGDGSRLWLVQFLFEPEMTRLNYSQLNLEPSYRRWIHSCNPLAWENFRNLHFVVFLAVVVIGDGLVVADLATDWAVLMLHCKFPFGFDWRQLKFLWSYDFSITWFNLWSRHLELNMIY